MLHRGFLIAVLFFGVAPHFGWWPMSLGQEVDIEAAKAEASSAIANQIESYVAAFNAHDAKQLVSHWSPRGVHSNSSTGKIVVGREALEKHYDELFKAVDNLKLEIVNDEIEFISPSVAIGRGLATVSQTGTDRTEQTNYSAVFVFRDNRWLIDRISDDLVMEQDSHHEHLEVLEPLLGKWVNETAGTTIEFECKWTRDNNHISRAYRVVEEDNVTQTGLQIIGWDPRNKQIRSWLFDSEGGFVEGTWQNKDGSWLITTTGVLPDGGTGTAVHVVRPIDENHMAFRKTNQVIDGVKVPDSDETIIQRQ
jgi:uncharacterized protein (TIGR02246 family)